MQPAERIAVLPPYFFASLSRELDEIKRAGNDVIRMDIGSPDGPPAPFIVEALRTAALRPDAHGYAPHGGTPRYRQAITEYYRRRFGVELDPESEVTGLIGSKEGIFHIAAAYVNPGDVVLVPDPGYPVYSIGARMAGGEVVRMPLLAQNDYLPDLDAIPGDKLRRAKLLWLNYPNNPTAATIPMGALEALVEFARRHRLLLCHDAPYIDVCYDGYSAPSLLQVPGAKEVAVEFNSLSKTYNMAGWRLGMAVGNARAAETLADLKSNLDSGHFIPVLEAGAAALTGDQTWIVERNREYQRRRDLLMDGLQLVGLAAQVPKASLYIWARLPQGWASAAFTSALLHGAGISVTPGTTFGECGEGFVRLSLGLPTERVRLALARLAEWREHSPS